MASIDDKKASIQGGSGCGYGGGSGGGGGGGDGGASFISDLRDSSSIYPSIRATLALPYPALFLAFMALTTFLVAVSHLSPNLSSPCFAHGSHGPQFSSLYYCFFPPSKQPINSSASSQLRKGYSRSTNDKNQNQKQSDNSSTGFGLKKGVNYSASGENQSQQRTMRPANGTIVGVNSTSFSPIEKQRQNVIINGSTYFGNEDDPIKPLMDCDMFDGEWVRDDESYPLYKPGSCTLIDEQFNCFLNGRPDHAYCKLKWKPKACTLPRLDGRHMLELLRGKRLVFVGDSLNRNMWESLICILRNSMKDHEKVYEQSHKNNLRSEATYSFVFEEYNCTLELFVAPFLVRASQVRGKNGTKKDTLRLDRMSRYAERYKNADIIVFNSANWWSLDKTFYGKEFYQEGDHVYPELNPLEAYRKGLTTWARWIDANINPMKSLVFFRGYSTSHFSGGQWNSGGHCNGETEPIKEEKYLAGYPPMMAAVLEEVLKQMKTEVTYLNVTRMTDYRKDGHPSVYRKQGMSEKERRSQTQLRIQDCSHWCLPGVPDAWNEILYAQLLLRLNHKRYRQ